MYILRLLRRNNRQFHYTYAVTDKKIGFADLTGANLTLHHFFSKAK